MEQSWGPLEQSAAERLITLGLLEDLGDRGDLTCQALIESSETATVNVVARQAGVLCGNPVGKMVFQHLDPSVRWTAAKADGQGITRGEVVARVTGAVASLLTGERTMLNFMTHLSGIATVTSRYVEKVRGTRARVLDTRKTHPGYRVLEKYAVRCGGGVNHRFGLYDGVLIKDNHLAAWQGTGTVADAIRQARTRTPGVGIEVEVDTLEQLADAMGGGPEIVLLDNMTVEQLRQAVAMRDKTGLRILLEASGGVTLETIGDIAATGVERISVGALTHSAPALDLAFDWSNRVA